jgi:DNA-binding response OmpR family regulator
MISTTARPTATLRLAVGDEDDVFTGLLAERCRSRGWELQPLRMAGDRQEILASKAKALLLDPVYLQPRGWERLASICAELPQLPVVVATGPSAVSTRVRGLRLGVEDWITKPCDPIEVLARVEAVSRSRSVAVDPGVSRLRAGEIELWPGRRVVFVGDRHLELTPREFEVLRMFLEADRLVIEREQIYQRVWGYAMPWGDRSVDVYVMKLRRKLRAASPGWDYLHTQYRIGYRFEACPLAPGGPARRFHAGRARVTAGR